jgi:hypothetical protein
LSRAADVHPPVLIDIPYWYEATVIRHRCRVEDHILLRTAVPYAMPHLTAEEAKPALTVALTYAPAGRKTPFSLTWLTDGADYLRPLRFHAGERQGGLDPDYYGGGEPMTLERLRAILRFEADFDFSRHELPERWLFDRNPKLFGIKFKGRRVERVDPLEIETPEIYDTFAKRWISSRADQVGAEALRDAQRYVLVEGVVHRRVPMPVWSFHGTPALTHGEALPGRESGLRWPIGLTADFDAFIAERPAHAHAFHEAEAEYHMTPDLRADLARIGSHAIDGIWQHLMRAAPHLSDRNIDRYKKARTLKATAASDFADCATAMSTIEAMLPDPGWDAAKKFATDHVRHPVAVQVAHWKRLMHAADAPILTDQEDEALAALSG